MLRIRILRMYQGELENSQKEAIIFCVTILTVASQVMYGISCLKTLKSEMDTSRPTLKIFARFRS